MEQQIFFSLDSVEARPTGTHISGWVFARSGEASVRIAEELPHTLRRVPRPDVAAAYAGLPVPEEAGFEIDLEPTEVRVLHFIFAVGSYEVKAAKALRPYRLSPRRLVSAGRRLWKRSSSRTALQMLRLARRCGLRTAGHRLMELARAGETGAYQAQMLHGRPLPAQLRAQRQHRFAYEPLISLIVPVFNTPPRFLREMLDSVLAQTYARWELCLADGSTEPGAEKILAEYAARDDRIKYVRLEGNRGISGNSNAALALAEGDYIALFDHDDLLAEEALYECVRALNAPASGQDADGALPPDMLYTDEDKVDESGTRFFDPHYKPDFSPDYLRSLNYICHLTLIGAPLLKEIGREFRGEFDGAQDYDLILRASERAARIEHIPKVLYHWRMHGASTAADPRSKGYTHEAGRRALEAHLARLGRAGTVRDGAGGRVPNAYKTDYALFREGAVSVIIPSCDHAADLRKCLASIREKTSYPADKLEIIVAENNSRQPETFACYEDLERQGVRVLRWPGAFNYSAINNWAARQARGEYLLFLNNDIEIISPDWLEQLVMYAQFPENGAVGGKLYYPDGTVQHAGVIIGIGGVAGHAHKYFPREAYGYFSRLVLAQNVSAVTAAMLLIRREVFEAVSGFDERLAVAFNDVDFCLRVREAGYRNIFNPEAEAWHYESKSRGKEYSREKLARFEGERKVFYDRWGGYARDPYYNVNLTSEREDFSLREPGRGSEK